MVKEETVLVYNEVIWSCVRTYSYEFWRLGWMSWMTSYNMGDSIMMDVLDYMTLMTTYGSRFRDIVLDLG